MSAAVLIREAKQRIAVLETVRQQATPTGESDVGRFLLWLQDVSPTWTWTWLHLLYVQAQLDRVTSGENKRLMLFMPPRHCKSEMATVRYPVFRLEQDPRLRVIIAAYNQTLAEKFSRKARRIARDRLALNQEKKAAADWETMAGGGVRAAGVGSGISGHGADLAVIDDPVKGREEAESEAYRESTWEWYTDELRTRLEPHGAIILIMTRWHQDDLAGRILASEDGPNWTVVSLPAEAEEGDPLGRPLGAPLCPARFDLAALENLKMVLGSSYHALYQQAPQPPGGVMFRREWFRIVQAAPVNATRVRYWDKASTEGGSGARSSGSLMSRTKAGIYYIDDITKGRWSSGARETIIRQTCQTDNLRYNGRVTTWHEQEPGSGGKESAENTVRNLAGYDVHSDRVTGDKVTRARPLAAQAEAGNVYLVAGEWNAEFLAEICAFPTAKLKDQVDSCSGAFNKLAAVVAVQDNYDF